MLHLLDEQFSLPQQFLQRLLGSPPVRDALNGEQNRRVMLVLVEDLPRIQEHDPLADVGEFVRDLVALQLAALRHDLFKQLPQTRNVPLAIAEGEEQPAEGMLPVDTKRQIERPACRNDTEILIEYEKWLTHSVNDRLCERPSVVNASQRLAALHGLNPCVE